MWGVGLGSAWVLERGLRAMDSFPVNVGLLGRGSSSRGESLREAIDAHVCGLKVHEDTGATLRTIDTALRVADEFDFQVALHTDGLNETMSVKIPSPFLKVVCFTPSTWRVAVVVMRRTCCSSLASTTSWRLRRIRPCLTE